MTALLPTCDRKTKFWAHQKNTFGLLPGPSGSCPGATTAAGGCWHVKPGQKLPICYAKRNMTCYGGVRRILEHNTRLLKRSTTKTMTAILQAEIDRFRNDENRAATKQHRAPILKYRLHWSGDIFNAKYAKALATVIARNPDILFWTYTRSFFAVPYFARLSNLILYLSLDPVNQKTGLAVYHRYRKSITNFQLSYMSPVNDFKPVSLLACPVDSGKLALEGGCAKCNRCCGNPKATFFEC